MLGKKEIMRLKDDCKDAKQGPDPARWAWLTALSWVSADPNEAHYKAAKKVIKTVGYSVKDKEARDKLARVLCDTYVDLYPQIWTQADIGGPKTKLTSVEGYRVEQHTAKLHKAMASRFEGNYGKEILEEATTASQTSLALDGSPLTQAWQDKQRQIWELWISEEAKPIVWVAWFLWPEIKRALTKKRKSEVAHTPQLALTPVIELASGKAVVQDNEIFNQRGEAFGKIAPMKGQTIEALTKHLEAFQHVAGHKVFRAVVRQTHENLVAGKADPRVIKFKGGRQGMCRALGLNSKKDQSKVKEVLEAGAAFQIKTPRDFIGGLWTYWERRGGPGQPGFVRIVAGDPLCYEAILTQPKSLRSCRAGRNLIPELRFDPPTEGVRTNDHGKVWNLSRLFVVELRSLWRDLIRYGAGRIPEKRWEELADQAGLPKATLRKVLDVWLRGESDDAPALIERVDDLYRLASSHNPEMAFLIDGAKLSQEGKKAGKRRGKKKK